MVMSKVPKAIAASYLCLTISMYIDFNLFLLPYIPLAIFVLNFQNLSPEMPEKNYSLVLVKDFRFFI